MTRKNTQIKYYTRPFDVKLIYKTRINEHKTCSQHVHYTNTKTLNETNKRGSNQALGNPRLQNTYSNNHETQNTKKYQQVQQYNKEFTQTISIRLRPQQEGHTTGCYVTLKQTYQHIKISNCSRNDMTARSA